MAWLTNRLDPHRQTVRDLTSGTVQLHRTGTRKSGIQRRPIMTFAGYRIYLASLDLRKPQSCPE